MSNIINLSFLPPIADKDQLQCPQCGAVSDLKCHCGVDYKYMRASEIAEKAVMENPEKSDRAIAEQIGVDHKTVAKARIVSGENSPNNMRIGRIGKDGVRRASGRQVFLPDGYKCLSEIITATLNLELSGSSRTDACKQTGVSRWAYERGRDTVLLSRRTDLSDADMRIVKKALFVLDQKGEVAHSGVLVKPISKRIWGVKKHRLGSRTIKKKIESFQSSISFLLATCVNAADIEIPYLSNLDRETIIKEIKEAETALFHLRGRINNRSKPHG